MKIIKPKKVPENANIIDTLSDYSFKFEHVKGSRNFCVYEIDFAQKIKKAFRDRKTPLYFYGLSNKTGEVALAGFILNQLGYKNVYAIDGGLKAWKSSGLPVTVNQKKEAGKDLDGNYIISKRKSRIEWTGRNIGNKHTGTVKINKGQIRINKGLIVGGSLEINMESISNSDLQGVWRKTLEKHLKSSDFFDVKRFSTAQLKLVEARRIGGDSSKPNFVLTGKLKMKGIEEKVIAKAQVHKKDGWLVINSHLDLDRSKWNVAYGSESFFARLGKHIIDDVVSLDLILFGKRT